MKWIAIAILGFSLAAAGQTAKVIALSPEDAKMAQEIDKQVDAALKRRQDFYETVRMKYIGGNPAGVWGTICLTIPCAPAKHDYPAAKPGWETGFEFSDDWKYIVPIRFISLPYSNNGHMTFIPASGTITQ